MSQTNSQTSKPFFLSAPVALLAGRYKVPVFVHKALLQECLQLLPPITYDHNQNFLACIDLSDFGIEVVSLFAEYLFHADFYEDPVGVNGKLAIKCYRFGKKFGLDDFQSWCIETLRGCLPDIEAVEEAWINPPDEEEDIREIIADQAFVHFANLPDDLVIDSISQDLSKCTPESLKARIVFLHDMVLRFKKDRQSASALPIESHIQVPSQAIGSSIDTSTTIAATET